MNGSNIMIWALAAAATLATCAVVILIERMIDEFFRKKGE